MAYELTPAQGKSAAEQEIESTFVLKIVHPPDQWQPPTLRFNNAELMEKGLSIINARHT